MKELKRKSVIKGIVLFILTAILGSFFLFVASSGLMKRMEGAEDLATLDYDGDLDGVYVTGTLEFIYDYYCDTTQDGSVVNREYIIDAGDFYYMGLSVPKANMKKSEKLMEASWAFMDGEDDGSMVYASQYKIRGTIHKMSSDSLRYYKQYLDWDSMDSEEQEAFLPYYLVAGEVAGTSESTVNTFLAFGIILWVIAFILIILPLSGHYQKQVKKYIASSNNPDMTREKIETFLANTKDNKGLRYDGQFICAQLGMKTVFQETSKLAWVYLKTITHKKYFITVGHSYYLVLGFADGNRYEISIPKEETVLQYIQELSERFPNIVVGYSDDLDRMFRKDLSGFLQMKYYSVEQPQNNSTQQMY